MSRERRYASARSLLGPKHAAPLESWCCISPGRREPNPLWLPGNFTCTQGYNPYETDPASVEMGAVEIHRGLQPAQKFDLGRAIAGKFWCKFRLALVCIHNPKGGTRLRIRFGGEFYVDAKGMAIFPGVAYLNIFESILSVLQALPQMLHQTDAPHCG